MILTVNLRTFHKEFLSPILEVNNLGKAAIFVNDNELYSISQTTDNKVILYNTYTPVNIEDKIDRFNIKLNSVVKGLNCVNKTELLSTFEVSNNSFIYKDDLIKFNVRLLSDNMLTVPRINVEVVKAFPFTSEFYLDSAVLFDIKKALDFASTSSKFYIEIQDNKLYFLFGDRSDSANMYDDIKILVTDQFSGSLPNNIFNTDILKLIMKAKTDVVFKIGKHAMMAELKTESSTLRYITTSLKE